MERTHTVTTASHDPSDQNRSAEHRDRYVVAFNVHLRTILSRSQSRHMVDEAVSRETLRVVEQADRLMRDFPDPHTLARVVASGGRAIIGALRAEFVQRGAGIKGRRDVMRLHDDSDWVYEHPDQRRPNCRRQREATAGHTELGATIDDLQLLKALLAPLSKRQRTVLMLVDGYGYTVTEAAAILGIARETAARDRSSAYRSLDRRPPV